MNTIKQAVFSLSADQCVKGGKGPFKSIQFFGLASWKIGFRSNIYKILCQPDSVNCAGAYCGLGDELYEYFWNQGSPIGIW